MANIKDIARLSGVAPSTVSAVLTGRTERVKASTRDRIVEVMRELRYVPSPLFYGSHAQSVITLGVVFFASYEANDEELDPYYLAILEGILAVGIRRGCNIISMPTRSWENCARTLRVYVDGRCDGLLLLNPSGTEEIVKALQERNYPFVLVNAEKESGAANSVGVDIALGANAAMEHLFELGHSRIAFLAGNGIPGQRVRTYVAALKGRGIPVTDRFMPRGNYVVESGRERTLALMKDPTQSPTAIFCETDHIAAGALQALRELRIDVPGQVSVIGFDDLALASSVDPPLTTVRRPLLDIGREAGKLLLKHVNDASAPVENLKLPVELIVRGTTGPCPV